VFAFGVEYLGIYLFVLLVVDFVFTFLDCVLFCAVAVLVLPDLYGGRFPETD
jgi:hypothetical protein